MVKKGSQTRNNKAVRDMVSNKRVLADDQYVITDALNNIIIVDTEEGKVYKYVGDDIIECNTADTSKKQNGYLYVDLAIMADNKITVINYAQHSLIAMLAHTSDYDNLVEEGKTPIVNHKDNCPWNNNSRNLEWTTQQLNTLHGRIVEAMTHLHNSTNGIAWLGFDLYKQYSNNKHSFDGLKIQLSCEDIKAYENHVGQKLTKFWNLSSKTSLLSNYDFEQFIVWWAKQNNINLNSFKEVA